MCGAFWNKAREVARNSNSGCSIGFGAMPHTAKAYDRPLALQDLIDFGIMPEFMGRIQRIVNLQPMTLDDYYKIMDSGCGPVGELAQSEMNVLMLLANAIKVARKQNATINRHNTAHRRIISKK